MKLGIGEILLIIVVALFVVGPDRIPEFARKFGEALKAFRNATSGVTKEIRENVIEPLNEVQAPLREALEPINDIKNDLNSIASGVRQDLEGVSDEVKKQVEGVTDELNHLGDQPKTIRPGEETESEEETPAAAASLSREQEPAGTASETDETVPVPDGQPEQEPLPAAGPVPAADARETAETPPEPPQEAALEPAAEVPAAPPKKKMKTARIYDDALDSEEVKAARNIRRTEASPAVQEQAPAAGPADTSKNENPLKEE